MAVSHKGSGSWAYAASGSVTPTLPAHAAGDMLVVRVAAKSSAIATCDASCATSGWAKVGQTAGATNSGNGTGSVLVAAFWKVAASGSETNPTIDFSQTVTQVGHVAIVYQKGASETWVTPVGDGGLDEGTANTSHSATIASHVSVTAGDMVDFFTGIRDDCTMTVPTITQTGVTYDTVSEQPATAGTDTSGADGAYDGGYRLASSGTSSAAAVVTGTLSTSEQGTSWMTRLRVFTPEEHNGTVTATGGGVATVTGRLNAATSVSGTGGGVATTSATKQGRASVAATGGGVSTQTFTGAHAAVHTLTGGGVATVVPSGAHVSDAVTATGGGVATVVGSKGGLETVAATAGGVATVSGTKQGLGSATGTGGGVASLSSTGAHVGSAVGTGGGVVSQTQTTARFGTSTATGGGSGIPQGQMGAQGQVLATGGGVATVVQTTARAADVSATGGGVATVVGTSSEGGAQGSVVATGGGTAVVSGVKNALAVVAVTGAGVATVVGEAGGGEQHSGSVVATGGGVAVLSGSKQARSSVFGTGGGTVALQQTTARSGAVVATGGGVASVSGQQFVEEHGGSVVATGGGTASVVYLADWEHNVVSDLVYEAVVAHEGDVFEAGQWLLVNGARRAGRNPGSMRDPLLGSIRRKHDVATYALACVSLGMEGVVLDDLKRVGGVA